MNAGKTWRSSSFASHVPPFGRGAARPGRCSARLRGGSAALFLVLAIAALGGGCGKKGPPLAPILRVPAVARDVVARRTGDSVQLQLRIPAANADNIRPADIKRVEVYAVTGEVTEPADIVKYGTLIASIPVRRPEEEGQEAGGGKGGKDAKAGKEADGKAQAPARPPRPPASMTEGFDQDDLVVVTEELGPEQRAEVEIKRRGRKPPPVITGEDPWQPILLPPLPKGGVRRYYVVGVNGKGQRGGFTPPQPVPLTPAPSAPAKVTVAYDAKGLTLSWTPSPDVPSPVQAIAGTDELASAPLAVRSRTGGYNVYALPEAAGASKAPVPGEAVPVADRAAAPLNDAPIEQPTFTLAGVEYGKQRCFAVRAVAKSGIETVESPASPPACVTPVDTFPPSAPKNLAAVASQGAVSLIWEPVSDQDLAGYVVMRAEPGKPASPLTPQPVKETTYRDSTAAPGVRYTYTVVAVDTAGNRSDPSNAVEEAAR